jgi:rhodanese-related sulfurtransferase
MNALNELPSVDVDTAAGIAATVVLLDVREHDEWTAGHAPAAVHIPLSDLPDRLGEFEPGRRVVCMCRSGSRSGRATAWLRSHGVDAVNMAGGMQAWSRAGHPVVDDHGRLGAVR